VRSDVVVIDDDPAMLMLLRETLVIGGYSVHAYSSGKDAIAAADWSSVRTLVVDWMMPEMNGVDMATWVRDNHPTIQRLIVTAAIEALLMTQPDVEDLAQVIAKTNLPGAMLQALDAVN
jgi:DNA-binding response OmpR family regulator